MTLVQQLFDSPQERIDVLLDDASIELLVTQSSLTSRLKATDADGGLTRRGTSVWHNRWTPIRRF